MGESISKFCLVLLIVVTHLLPVVSWAQVQNKKIDSLQAALEQSPDLDTNRVALLNQLGYEYWIVAPAQSEKYGKEALELARDLHYRTGMAFAHRVIGVSHWARGDYQLGLTSLFLSLDQYQNIEDRLGEANALMNIGLIYGDQHNYESALTNYFEAIAIFESLDATGRIGTTYNKIGSIYADQGKYDQAKSYLQKGLEIHQKESFNYGIAESYNRLGLVHRDMGKLNRALDYCFKSLELSKAYNDINGSAKTLENLGSIYLLKEDYKNAEKYLLEGKELAQSVGSKEWLKDIYFDLKEVALAQGNYLQAFEYFDQHILTKDSLFNEEKAIQMANLQTEHELAQKETDIKLKQQEIVLLQQQAKLDQWFRYGLILGLIALGLLAYLTFKALRVKIRNAKDQQDELKKELNSKSKELTTYTLNFIQKNEMLEELKEKIQEISKQGDHTVSKKLNSLGRMVDHSFNLDKDWDEFRIYFEQVHQEFFVVLKQRYPDISNSEQRLCALIRLNLSMKEAATILGISPDSVKTARYRLRKKLGLSTEDNLVDFIMNLENTASAT